MTEVAEFIGKHALLTLSIVALLLLAITALLWHLLQRHGATVARMARVAVRNIGERMAPHTSQFKVPKALPWTWAIARRIGMQALISAAVAVAALAVFFSIADEIGADEDLARFDEALRDSLQRHASPALLLAFARITHLGDSAFLTVLATIIALVLIKRRQWLLGSAWVAATLGGALLNPLLKGLFERVRPVHSHGVIAADGWSFPSGHASGSFTVYTLLAYILIVNTPQAWHIPTALLAVTLAVFVGFSRVILQVHYLSDVMAGYAFAAAWCGMWIAGLEIRRSGWRIADRQRSASAESTPETL